MDTTGKRLILFDLDETLVALFKNDLLPGVAEWFAQKPAELQVGICTNQGGVGLRYWMERDGFGQPGRYPTKEEVDSRLALIADSLGVRRDHVYRSFAFLSKQGNWSPAPPEDHPYYDPFAWDASWRKPGCGMIKFALAATLWARDDVLFVGDSEEDRLAAEAANVDFVWAWEFFGRRPPEEEDLPF